MMAASAVGMGISGKSSPVMSPSPRSSGPHDAPIVTPSPAPSSTSSTPSEVSYGSSPNELSSSSAGKQLAVSSHPGPAASPVPSICDIEEDETNIALSQLKELDIAIEVRKVTKVDGRKTRWIEYRKRKQFDSTVVKEEVESPDYTVEKPQRKSFCGKKSLWPVDINENSSPPKIAEKTEPSCDKDASFVKQIGKELFNSNNNNNNNNISVALTTMKVEPGSVVSNSLNTGTSNVLETMKQQFLQGTVNVPENASNGVKEKVVSKKQKSLSLPSPPSIGNRMRRKPGRPKKERGRSTGRVAIKSEKIDDNSTAASVESSGILDSESSKVEGQIGVSQGSPDFYSRRNYLTKGLREVRKSESGSESNSSSPEKNSPQSSHMSPSTPLPVSPTPPWISDSSKCPLITAAAKVLSSSSINLVARKKKILRKLSRKQSLLNGKSNGHSVDQQSHVIRMQNFNYTKKRGRGRPKGKEVGRSKKTMVIADVHNTMNGEPQTVIPANNRMVQTKRKVNRPSIMAGLESSRLAKLKKVVEMDSKSNKTSVCESIVPNQLNETSLSSSPTPVVQKASSTQSASRFSLAFDAGKSEGTRRKLDVATDIENKELPQGQVALDAHADIPFTVDRVRPKNLPIASKDSKLTCSNVNNNNNNILYAFSDDKANEADDLCLKLGNIKPQGIKKPMSMIIVSTAEAVKKSLDKKQRIASEESGTVDKTAEVVKINNKGVGTSNAGLPNGRVVDIQNNENNGSVVVPPENAEAVPNETECHPSIQKSVLQKSPKKTPDKFLKGKSLNAVIEKLHSPLSKKTALPPTNSSLDQSYENSLSIRMEVPTFPVPKYPEIKIEVEDGVSELPLDGQIPDEGIGTVKESDQHKLAKPIIDKSIVAPEKPKDKVPRFLKQLFQDEGVQNMLRSVNEETISGTDGYGSVDSSSHKLRPKRGNENFVSDSPEPDDSLNLPFKRKKRGTEVDNLFLDEGALNMLTSLEGGSRRPTLQNDDAASDTSQASSSKSLKINKIVTDSITIEPIRKRRVSGGGPPLPPQEPKKLKSDDKPKTPIESAVIGISANESQRIVQALPSKVTIDKKQQGRPSLTVTLKQKAKLQIQMNLKQQLQRLGIPHENLSIAKMKEELIKAYNPSIKSVPPLKIKLPSAGSKNVVKVYDKEPIKEQATSSGESSTSSPDPIQKRSKLLNKPADVTAVSSSSYPEAVKPSQLVRAPLSQPSPQYPLVRKLANLSGNSSLTLLNLVQPLDRVSTNQKSCKLKAVSEGLRHSQRASVRQSEGSYSQYRDISLRKYNNFMQIILTPSTTKMKNALNSRVLRELCEALNMLRRDDSVRMVLFTSTGSTFCQGIDLTSLQHSNLDIRKKNAENLARGIKEFLRALVQFPKIIIAGVNGNAMGLGVTMLPLFDMVIATDKAEFFLPYMSLGQVPEGGATYTFPHYFGKLQSNKLFWGQKITANQAQQMGLVTESIWPATFLQELIPKVALLASQSQQGMEGTKALMNHHILTKLELSVESECRVLLQQWMTQTFSHSCKRFVETADIQLQKPVILPL